jgi:hypothetical protein
MTIYRAIAGLAALASFASATPAAASTWLVSGQGLVAQNPTPPGETRLEGLPFVGRSAFFLFTIDTAVGGVDLPPPLGIGTWRAYPGAITSFSMNLGGLGVSLTGAAARSLNVVDNVPDPGNTRRIDQLTWSESATFPGGVLTPALASEALAPDQFIGNFTFGRVVSTPALETPAMIDGTAIPALDSAWFTGAPGLFFSFDVRQGPAANAAQSNALPRARLAVAGLQLQATMIDGPPAVPEPASWALMILGFGAVGLAARRRAPQAA